MKRTTSAAAAAARDCRLPVRPSIQAVPHHAERRWQERGRCCQSMLWGRRSRRELRRMAGRLNTTREMRRMRSWH